LWEAEGRLGLYASLEGVSTATLVAWLDKMRPPDTGTLKRQEMRQAIAARLAASDPVRLAAWMQTAPLQLTEYRDSSALLLEATRGLLAAGTGEAAKALEKLKKRYPDVAKWELTALAEKDPATAFEILQKQISCHFIPSKLAAWLAKDAAKAADLANRNPEIAWLIASAVAKEGDAALEAFGAGITAGARYTLRMVQMNAAAEAGDAASFARLCSELKETTQEEFRTLVHAHPEAVEETARQLAGKPAMCADLWYALAQTDPPKAISLLTSPAFAGAMNEITLRRSYVLSDWHDEDPVTAVAWVKTQPPEILAALIPNSGELVADLSTSEWLSLTSQFPVTPETAGYLTRQALAKLTDTGMFVAWCQTVPGGLRSSIIQELTNGLVQRDLNKATALVLAQDDPQLQHRLLESMYDPVAKKTPAEALGWAATLPPEMEASAITGFLPGMVYAVSPERVAEVTSLALQRVNSEPPETASRWNAMAWQMAANLGWNDTAACQSFMAGLPDAVRRSAAEGVASRCDNLFDATRIDSSLTWIAGLNDPALREALAKSICESLAKNPLSPETTRRVEQTLTPFIQ
jgi:hypothetical protein